MSAIEYADEIEKALGARKFNSFRLCQCLYHVDSPSPPIAFRAHNGILEIKAFCGCSQYDVVGSLVQEGILCHDAFDSIREADIDKIPVSYLLTSIGVVSFMLSSTDYFVESSYLYADADGRKVGAKVYLKPSVKAYFEHRELNKNYKCAYNGLPYRLPQLLDSLTRMTGAHFFSHERDADAAYALGLRGATCTEWQFPGQHLRSIRGNRIVLWCAQNESKQATGLAAALSNNGADVKLVEIPHGQSFYHWSYENISLADIEQLIAATPVWTNEDKQVAALKQNGALPADNDYDLGTEAHTAEIYADQVRDVIRYNTVSKTWMSYTDGVWQNDEGGMNREKAKALAGFLRGIKPHFTPDVGKAFDKQIKALQSDAGVSAVIRMARTIERLHVTPTNFDDSTTFDLFSCKSGVIHLPSLVVKDHSPEFYITRSSPFEVDFDNEPKRFLKFMDELFSGRTEVVEFLLNFFGYCMTARTEWQHYQDWTGKPGSGKSQLQTIIRLLFANLCGDISSHSLASMNGGRSAGADSDLAKTQGTRVVFASEMSTYFAADEQTIKAISGGDPIPVKFMGQDKFPLQSRCKLVFTSNGNVKFRTTSGIERRVVIIRFENRFHDDDPSNVGEIGAKIVKAEGPQILGLFAKRAQAYIKDPSVLKIPTTIRNWTERYLHEIETETENFPNPKPVELEVGQLPKGRYR